MVDLKNNKYVKALAKWGNDTSRDKYTSPAVLFENATEGSKFPQMYLFSQFGQAQTTSISETSQITTHYTEDNYHINDHWALDPLKITLTGLIGELVYRPPKNWSKKAENSFLKNINPLRIIAPRLDRYTQAASTLANTVEASLKRYEDIAKKALRAIGLSDSVVTSNQYFVITELEAIRDNRILVDVYTTYGIYANMAITAINMRQENTNYQSNLEIQLQKWRTAENETRDATEDEKAELARVQQAPARQHGVIGTTQQNINNNSTLKNLVNP